MYAPYGTPSTQLTEKFLSQEYNLRDAKSGDVILQKLEPAWVALIEIVHRIEKQAYHEPVGRVIFQKIAYVATVLGIPTGLTHVRSSYGPYCKELNDVKNDYRMPGCYKSKKVALCFKLSRVLHMRRIG